MTSWDDRQFVACTACGEVYVGRPNRAGTYAVASGSCRQCGNASYEPVGE